MQLLLSKFRVYNKNHKNSNKVKKKMLSITAILLDAKTNSN